MRQKKTLLSKKYRVRQALQFSLWLALLCAQAWSEEPPAIQLTEGKIKAGLLYNFIKYTEWPSTKMADGGAMTVCVFGDDQLDSYLKPMGNFTVKQRRIAIRHIHGIADSDSCHLLFVCAEKKDLWAQLHDLLADKSILTVGDFTGFSNSGGMIQITKENSRIKIELNAMAIKKSRLDVSMSHTKG
jgi:hypothetical protein